MFNIRELKNMTSDIMYRRGELLERTGGVYDFTAEPARGQKRELLQRMKAFVRGTKQPFHTAEVFLDAKTLDYWGARCDCPDFARIDGLCEHCTALALYYFHNEEKIRKTFRSLPAPSKPKRRTEAGLADLLNRHGEKERMRLTGDPTLGQVQLEPTLHIDGGEASLTLRIGIDRMYVVRDICALVHQVRNMENHTYGKNLSFVHQPEAFDGRSRPLMEFLLRNVQEEEYWYRETMREYPLGARQIDELLEIVGKEGFLLEERGKDPAVWTMTDEPRQQKISFIGKDGGAELRYTLPRRLMSRSYSYYFVDKKRVIYRELRAEPAQEELETYLYGHGKGQNYPFVAEEDLPLFVRDLLPMFEQRYQVETKDLDLSKYQPEEAQFQVYLDLPQENMITCDLVAVYSDGKVYHVFYGVPQKGGRNVPQELQMQALVSGYCNAMDADRGLGVAADDEDCMYRLLTEGVQRFRECAEVYLSDQLRRIAQVQRPSVTVGVSLSGDLLNLKISSEGMPLDQLAAILSRYDRRKKFVRLGNGAFFSMEDENLETLAQVKKGLMLSDRQMSSGEVSVPKFRALFLDTQLRESEELSVRRSRDFKALIRQMHTVEDSDYEVPGSLEEILREYQKTGYRWMETLCENGFCGILADDMGLGKTLQVITFLTAHYEKADDRALRTLVVCPASLVYNWANECSTFSPALPVFIAAGSAQERRALLAGLPEQAVVITSYELLKRDQEIYGKMSFDYEIIDEAQFIKNAGTKAAQAVKVVPSGFRMALTGTPVENRLSELWSIFDYLMPGYLYSYQKFRKELEVPIVQDGDEEAMQRLQRMISPFVLRRLKKDVLKDLPDKIERDMVARMEGEQKELYEAHVQRLRLVLDKQTKDQFDRSKIQILAELTKLRQLCCDPALLYEGYAGGSAKLDLCMELVQNAIESGHKILLFSQFTTMLDRIAERLREKEIGFYMLTGTTPKAERVRLVNDFNSDETPVFCISLKAGGTGLNLTGADIVIHYDPWWNTAAQNQATDRTHRIGQKNVVMVYRLIAQDSIEDNIVKLQERKQELADQVLSGADAANPSFTREELMELLGGRI